jgi:hypothetical protein
MIRLFVLCVASMLALSDAAYGSSTGPSPVVVEKAIGAANRYVAKKYPEYDLSRGGVDVRSSSPDAKVIEVIYILPPDSIGGAPTVSLDRKSMTVIKATMGQ